MSGFTRDTKYYGDRLVYEATLGKWDRYHERHCGCDKDWVKAHIEQAGLKVVREGDGFIAITGKGLTTEVDEKHLTATTLWKAVTGSEGGQSWFEPVKIINRK